MRTDAPLLLTLFAACSTSAPEEIAVTPENAPATTPTQTLGADTPSATTAGNTFVAPVDWSLSVRGPATVLESPEGGSFVALVDLGEPEDPEAALAAALAAYDPNFTPKLKLKTAGADEDGWTDFWSFEYEVPPNAKRFQWVGARRANGVWTFTIIDMDQAVMEKRDSQVGLIMGELLPKGYERESFAGKKAHPLDEARIAALSKFIETAREQTGVPGVALGLVQDGKVVFEGGFGVRELGKPKRVDAKTKFMIASNTKALATLMLAKLVDDGKITWDAPVTSLLPSFKLGSEDTTKKVLVKHLICACTGMPRQDMEWLFHWDGVMPADVITLLGTMQPTSEFGALFQYSNTMAAAAGFAGGHVANPKLELGAAYDKAMQDLVFEPLGMKGTTHDFSLAQEGNYATPHAPDVDGQQQLAIGSVNESVVPVRPAGGAWSSVHDMLRYVQMELAEGELPDGSRYISRDALLARRAPQVAIGADATYGMGLMVDNTYDVTVVHHGGDMIGFHSDMMWLPDHGIGAVILTNGDPGWQIRTQFRCKLLEVLFDGRPEADAQSAVDTKRFFAGIAADRTLSAVPADAEAARKLAARYTNPALGEIAVTQRDGAVVFDFGEYKSEVGSRKNSDGTQSFTTIVPGMVGLEFVVGGTDDARTLTVRDAQHEYVFTEGSS